ncbi:MAG TPA: hypothetical protein VFE47_11020 [Tepidisphaeraceae bacterium]|jgi:hypothetical protein|nr:hypothetical protein [Tepidisphaeraceae bacterium]
MIWRVVSLIVVLCCASAYGGSIFDDDYVPPKETPAPKPAKPARSPEVQPKPQPQPQPQQPANQNAVPPHVEAAPPDSPARTAAPAEPLTPQELLQAALTSAKESMNKAEVAVQVTLDREPSYVAVRNRAKAEADKGNPDAPAVIQEQTLRDAALAKDATYDAAKRYVTMLTRLSAAPKRRIEKEANPPKTQEEFLEGIKTAIAGHGLTEGMTFTEACKSARKPFTLMSKSGKTRTYHWILKGSNGTHQETHRDTFGHTHTETVANYGVIGYVEGVFEDDYLVSFSRGK